MSVNTWANIKKWIKIDRIDRRVNHQALILNSLDFFGGRVENIEYIKGITGTKHFERHFTKLLALF